MTQFHTFGPPCFILHPKLFQKKFIPKLTPKLRQDVYLGISPQHAGSVTLVLNLKTGYISPQFHIVFGDYFTTASARVTNKLPYNWNDIFNSHRELPPGQFQFSIGEKIENPDWMFRGRPQGKQQFAFWSDRGSKLLFYWEKYIPSKEASLIYQSTKKQLHI